jgi:4-hydroxyproline epimerase
MRTTNSAIPAIEIIDSHTGGEPTRVVVSGGPDLGDGSIAARLNIFRDQFDQYRSAIVNEPRGSDVLVGALLCEPSDASCAAGVIFFNNVGYLGMCGHGTIGLVVTLAHLGRVQPGRHRIETPVGVVSATLNDDGSVSVENVASHRKATGVEIILKRSDGARGVILPTSVTGDVAYGGNWFFLVENHGMELTLKNVEALTDFGWAVRQAVNAQGFPEVDHVELVQEVDGQSRTFVLCPGKAYDRSPCGTGTSAKLACLASDGKLPEGEEYVVESIIGSRFVGKFKWVDQEKGIIAPTVTGAAHITAEATLILDARDLYCWGIRSS